MPPKITLVVKNKKKNKKKQNKVKNEVRVIQAVTRKKRRAPKIRIKRSVSTPGLLAAQYIRCIADPFKYGPVRAGYDTLLPTQLHTAYFRGTIVANVDGTARIFINPSMLNAINYATSVATTTPVWNSGNFANTNVLLSEADQFRLLSMGIRCFPRIAATAAPGMCFMNLVPKMDPGEFNTYAAYTPNGASNMAYSQIHLASSNTTDFYQQCWRPGSVDDFTFRDYDNSLVTNTAGTLTFKSLFSASAGFVDTQTAYLDMIFTALPITGTGTPVGTPIFFEVIAHYETTDSTQGIAGESQDDASPSVASEGKFASMENMFRSMADLLPSSSSVAALAGTVIASPLISGAIQRYRQ
jgi:hypothetical protein